MNVKNIAKVISISGALASTAYAAYRVVSQLRARKNVAVANSKYDDRLADSMDCSDAVASY
ncbi:MAG TPA: hypothetical protein VK171_08775 [Fimbriimonas sp.]|nr:hypothetical protein [Fimbriimonas sp.]